MQGKCTPPVQTFLVFSFQLDNYLLNMHGGLFYGSFSASSISGNVGGLMWVKTKTTALPSN